MGEARSLDRSQMMVRIGIALGQAVYGPFSDRVGRKPALYVGLLMFFLSSVGCAEAPNVTALIVLLRECAFDTSDGSIDVE